MNKHKHHFTFRKAEVTDVPALVDFLAKLALHVSGGPLRTLKQCESKRLQDALKDTIADEDKLMVVADSPASGPVGMGYIHVWRSSDIWEQAGEVEYKSGVIDDVWVEPDYRGMGIFTAMLRKLVAFAEARGAQELILEYSTTNKEAEAAWSKLGFNPTGVRAAAFTTNVNKALQKK
jgi:ribosomal protein S18 acetylase RimI-like enzyme